MKYIKLLLFLFILSFQFSSHGSVACHYIFDLTAEKTTVENLKPTQMEYGFESIARRLSRMESEALAIGMSLSDYIQKHFLSRKSLFLCNLLKLKKNIWVYNLTLVLHFSYASLKIKKPRDNHENKEASTYLILLCMI